EGESLPFFDRHKLGLELNNHRLRLVDGGTGEERWSLALTKTQFTQISSWNTQPERVHLLKFPYQNLGHLVVLQLGHMMFGVDPLNKGRVLWEKNLSSLPGADREPPSYTLMNVDPKDGAISLTYADGWTQRIGMGPLQGSVVCVQTKDALT